MNRRAPRVVAASALAYTAAMKPIAFALLCTLPLAPAFSAEIYKWVDANGVTHFTQNPPERGTEFQRITPQLPPPTAAPGIDSLRKSQRDADSREAETSRTRDAGLKLKAETLERCAKARERMTFLQEKTARRLFRTGANGEEIRYTQEEFDAEVRKAQDGIDQNCN